MMIYVKEDDPPGCIDSCFKSIRRVLCCNCFRKEREEDKSYTVYFALKFSSPAIDKIAHNFDVYGNLDNTTIQYKFNKFMRKQFTVFDARQRYACIMAYLESEIDFDHLMSLGIITEHYPLH